MSHTDLDRKEYEAHAIAKMNARGEEGMGASRFFRPTAEYKAAEAASKAALKSLNKAPLTLAFAIEHKVWRKHQKAYKNPAPCLISSSVLEIYELGFEGEYNTTARGSVEALDRFNLLAGKWIDHAQAHIAALSPEAKALMDELNVALVTINARRDAWCAARDAEQAQRDEINARIRNDKRAARAAEVAAIEADIAKRINKLTAEGRPTEGDDRLAYLRRQIKTAQRQLADVA